MENMDGRVYMDRRATDSRMVKDDLEIKILKGYYGENGQVPTIKKISEDYGIGMTTASAIMRTLVDEGTLFSVQGKGFYVAPYCKSVLLKKHSDIVKKKMGNLIDYANSIDIDFMELAKTIYEKKKQQ